MKKYRSLTEILMLVGFFVLIGGVGNLQGAPSDPATTGQAGIAANGAGYLENITFEKMKGKERVTLLLSRPVVPATEDLGGRNLIIKLDNLYIATQQRRTWGEGTLDNLLRLVPTQQTTAGRPQALITMELARPVPYSIRQVGQQVVVEFNVATLTAEPSGGRVASADPQPSAKAVLREQKPQTAPVASSDAVPSRRNKPISLELQDANIKSVLQLMAEEGGVNIVSGDDVKGNVTVHMKKIPWDQALSTIMGITGLVKKEQGNIITVMTIKKLRDEEKDLKDAEKERRATEEDRKNEEQKKQVQEGKLRQISIEAKIVEATDEFTRKIGVQWGAGFTDTLKLSKGEYPYGIVAGANPIGGTPFGGMTGLAQGVAMTTTNLAANFPMASAVPSYALGMVINSAYGVLDAQIAASEKNNDVRIISTPKVTTMDGEKALIKQGDDIPVVTPATSQNPATVTFKEAVLKLEVTPTITKQGKISMVVNAKNDAADFSRAAQLQGNPPITKSEVDSKVVVGDGDTLVIGGILKQSTGKAESGLPWIAKIPILGWLFKYEESTKTRKQLLIFVTPRIIEDVKKPG